MIFWMTIPSSVNFLIQTMYVENISHPVKKDKGRTLRSFKKTLGNYGGAHFLRGVCLDFGDRVEVYKGYQRSYESKWTKIADLKIYTEKDRIADMPEHVLVKTNSLDFIRELFDLGKKVSWYDVDIDFFAADLVKFNFEHVWINLFKRSKIIWPTGKIFENEDIYGKKFIDHKNPTRPTKFAKKLGYWPATLRRRTNKMDYIRATTRIAKKQGTIPRFDRWCLRADSFRVYYNLLSITYMLCQKSIVAAVKNKTAPLE